MWHALVILFAAALVKAEEYDDMRVTKEQEAVLFGKKIGAQYKAVHNEYWRWTSGVIPYEFNGNDFSAAEKAEIKRAMADWQQETCLQFRPATSADYNRIRFQHGTGCNSLLGMAHRGSQPINLDTGCRQLGIYLHEIGHAIGLVHEHQLPSREGKVWVRLENVNEDWRRWFQTYNYDYVNLYGAAYDFQSIMHYDIYAFSKQVGRLQTIFATDPNYEWLISYAHFKPLSFSDVKVVNGMYQCGARCNVKCAKEAFVDKNCQCVTPEGYAKRRCINLHNSDAQCDQWAVRGECNSNPYFMLNHCRKSCDKCFRYVPEFYGKSGEMVPPLGSGAIKDCKNARSDCGAMQRKYGSCNNYFMQMNCRSHCGNCGQCRDNDRSCQAWARSGECKRNPTTVFRLCPKACGVC